MAVANWILLSALLLKFMDSVVLLSKGQQVPGMFIFGDSLFDNGNNNMHFTLAKANYPPYGIDYPDGPTGRFSNGRNVADFISELVGFDEPIPAFATASDQEILNLGVNYASAAAGILDDTGKDLGYRTSLSGQLLNHKNTISRIRSALGNSTTVNDYLSKCLYLINIGDNDYLNGYMLPQYYQSNKATPQQYAAELTQHYSVQLKTLYKYGARKIVVFGDSIIGCIPHTVAILAANVSKSTSCVDFVNRDVELYNSKLQALIVNLNNDLASAQFIYVNTYAIASGDFSSFGIKIGNRSCCEVQFNGRCKPYQAPCANRNEYKFWDDYHPSEAFCRVAAERAYRGVLPSHAYPFGIQRLITID